MSATTVDPPGTALAPPASVAARERRQRMVAAEVAAVLGAVVPVVVAAGRAVRDGWLAIGDNALFLLRARDVLTEHHPLLGTWTSASISLGENVNNPGPLYFDWLALPSKLLADSGLAIGAASLNLAAIVLAVVIAHRHAGPLAATALAASTAALTWSMGSQLLFDPWQPHGLLLPFLAYLVVVWALAGGRPAMLAWGAAIGSLIVQTHMSYAVLVPGLALVGLVGLAVGLHRSRATTPAEWPARRRTTARWAAVAVAVFALAWLQPLLEQVGVGPGDGGNLGTLASSVGSSERQVGLPAGIRFMADVFSGPDFWGRSSFQGAFLPPDDGPRLAGLVLNLDGLPPIGPAIAWLAGTAIVLGVAVLAGRRRHPRAAGAAAIALAALVLGLATTASLPVGFFGVPQHQLRWLWPIAAFTTFALLLSVASFARRAAAPALAVVAVFAGLAALPPHNAAAGPSADVEAEPTVRVLKDQLGVLEGRGPLWYDLRGLRFNEPYSTTVMAEMQRRGVPFVVSDEGWAAQVGLGRRMDQVPEGRLFIREGDGALHQPGARRIAFAPGLSASDRRQLRALRVEVGDHIAAHGLELSAAGKAALARGELELFAEHGRDPGWLLASGELSARFRAGHLSLEPGWEERLETFVDLQHRWDRLTVGLFLESPVLTAAEAEEGR